MFLHITYTYIYSLIWCVVNALLYHFFSFLHHNNITDIQPGAFIGLPNLKYLYVSSESKWAAWCNLVWNSSKVVWLLYYMGKCPFCTQINGNSCVYIRTWMVVQCVGRLRNYAFPKCRLARGVMKNVYSHWDWKHSETHFFFPQGFVWKQYHFSQARSPKLAELIAESVSIHSMVDNCHAANFTIYSFLPVTWTQCCAAVGWPHCPVGWSGTTSEDWCVWGKKALSSV